MENFINKFLNKIKFTINDQSMKDNNNNNNNNNNNGLLQILTIKRLFKSVKIHVLI